MRNFTIILATALLMAVAVTSCDSVLDTEPMGDLTSGTFYQSETHFDAATLAPYSTLLNLYYDQDGRGWFNSVMLPSDDASANRGGNDEDFFNWQPQNGNFSWLWDQSYKGIMRANTVLDRLPAADKFANEANKARYEAEAKFMRAYFYFILATNFGNVPIVDKLITNVDDARIGNTQPMEQVWDLIESDLDFASKNLPDSWDNANKGRATKYSALAMLGKARLFRAQWFNQPAKYGQAAEAFNQIVNSGKFSLLQDYGDNFRKTSENNAESLFEIQFTVGDNINSWGTTDTGGAAGSGRKIWTGAACDYENGAHCAPGAWAYGYARSLPSKPLQREFEPNDPRVYHTFYRQGDVYTTTGGKDVPYDTLWSMTRSNWAKYQRPFTVNEFPNNLSTNNERIIRYSDVLLMLAEAELLGSNNVARAAELINQVRARARNFHQIAYGQPAPEGTLPARDASADRDQMLKWLMHERRVELAGEVHRYDDLVRWHRAGIINIKNDIDFGDPTPNSRWSEKNLLRPIPQNELDNNEALKQNPGY